MTTFRNSLGQEQSALPAMYREVQVLGRPRVRRSFWRYAIEAWAVGTFIAAMAVVAIIIGGR